jgi:hypothetical protein
MNPLNSHHPVHGCPKHVSSCQFSERKLVSSFHIAVHATCPAHRSHCNRLNAYSVRGCCNWPSHLAQRGASGVGASAKNSGLVLGHFLWLTVKFRSGSVCTSPYTDRALFTAPLILGVFALLPPLLRPTLCRAASCVLLSLDLFRRLLRPQMQTLAVQATRGGGRSVVPAPHSERSEDILSGCVRASNQGPQTWLELLLKTGSGVSGQRQHSSRAVHSRTVSSN